MMTKIGILGHTTFTGKERDEETGYGYFGARYMDHELMTSFISVDRYADKYPFASPYHFCMWNPIIVSDPSGDTCIIANKRDQAFINSLLDPNSECFSHEFQELYYDLEHSDHKYVFQSWKGNGSKDGLFSPRKIDKETSLIQFTRTETADTKNTITGMSKYKVLFEETCHAWLFEKNNKTSCPSLINEAISWKFSTYAPGTKLFASNMEITVMGMMQFSDIWTIALYLGTGYGLFTLDHPLSKPLYPDLMFRPDNKYRRNLNVPEWHIYLPQCLHK